MKYRKLLITLLSVALVAVGMIAAALPASAQNRRLMVRLVTGKTIVVDVDVPPGTPLDAIKIPGVSTGIVSITDVTPASQTPSTTTTPAPAPKTTPKPKVKPKPKTSPKSSPKKSHGSNPKHELHGSGHKPTKKPNKHNGGNEKGAAHKPPAPKKQAPRAAGGAPTAANPTFSYALPGPAPIGVPNFFIDRFRIPPFLLPIYQAAGTQYNIPWQVLAGINEIETNYGTNLNVSTAGAVGWMQFLPSTFKMYGVDANNDGRKDPYNPVDAIFSAARYLKAAGGDKDIKKGIFAYNHADWYVQSVLLRAKLIGGLPADLIGSLTGLTQGHFPVAARARYADDLKESAAGKRVKGRNAAVPVTSNTRRRGIDIFSRRGAPVIAVNDGRIVKSGKSRRLGKYVVLQDVSGNTYTYGHLGSVAALYPVPKERKVSIRDIARELKLPKADPKPEAPATRGRQAAPRAPARHGKSASRPAPRAAASAASSSETAGKERLFANPSRPNAFKAGGERQVSSSPSISTFKAYFTRALGLNRKDAVLKPLRPGAQVIAGTILGRIGKDTVPKMAPHVSFEIRPAGRGAPRIDPKPILDGWKLLESTAIYRAAGKNPFVGPDAKNPSIGQILLLSKEALERRVLADPKVDIYGCGRRDIQAGQIDRRILATLEFLVASGMNPTISSLKCGHGYLTSSGNVSEHTTGDAVDIAKVNGVPIVGHQGPGSITELTIRRLLTLQGQMKPHQIISLMKFPGTDNTLSMADHYDHIHVGFHPLFGANTKLGQQIGEILKPGQWLHLIDRLNQIPNPTVSVKPSKYAIPVHKPKRAHRTALDRLLGRN